MRLARLATLGAFAAACGLDAVGELSPGSQPQSQPGSDGGALLPDGAPVTPPGDASANDAAAPDAPNIPGRKKSITFDPAKVAGALSEFPAWIELVDAQIGARAKNDASDIYFTASTGAALAHEIQRWDKASGKLGAWVRIPSLSNVAATKIYLRYGDATGAPAPAPATVFSSGFAAVWHLEDALATTAIAEATGARPGTAVALAPTAQVAAKLGGGIAFAGGTDEISFTNPFSNNGPHTISLWVSQASTTDNDALVVVGNAKAGESRWFHSRFDTTTAAVGFYSNDWVDPGVNIENAGFTLLHWVFDGAAGVSRIYRDGALAAGPFTHTGSNIDTKGGGGHIGNAPGGWGANMGLHATLDEVRIANVARSAEWIATEFANQSSPSTFYSVGTEELP